MIAKVKLPREVAEAIERVWNAVEDSIATKHMRLTNWNFLIAEVDGQIDLSNDLKVLMNYAERYPLEYVQALVNGYEVEQTPEEKVREYFKQLRADHDVWSTGQQSANSPYGYELTGCARTLNLLGIKIEGVNA